MHPYIIRSLAEERRRDLMASAGAHREVLAARAAVHASRAEELAGIWAERTLLGVRPIERDDADRLARLFGRMTQQSVRFRFFSPVRRLSDAQLARLSDVDHDRREALVALSNDEIVAVARYDAPEGAREAEIAVTVEDSWQGRGVGRRLSGRLSQLAVVRGIDTFVARILPDNRAALRLVRSLSPAAALRMDRGEYCASIPLARD